MEYFAGIVLFVFGAIGVGVVVMLLTLSNQLEALLMRLDRLLSLVGPQPDDPRHKPQRTFPRVVK